MSARHEFDVIGKRVGNFVVERALAHGAMGTVFVARHPTLGRQVAVKFLGRDEEVPADHAKRFLDEACITASLHHPNIVDIFDFGELDGRPYYVMELLGGRDLAAVIKRKRQFDSQEVLTYVQQICSGLDAAHAVGVVHRDLKPSNIFVLEGQPTRIKIMDFGVAKVMSAEGDRTRQGQIIGTPRYMSPEQALGQIDHITPQSDVYSLGVILYEMLAGSALFEHDSPMMLLVMHIRDEIPPLRDRCADVPAPIAQLIEACLSKRPERRPGSAREVAERFTEAMSHQTQAPDRCLSESSAPGSSLPPTVNASPMEPENTLPAKAVVETSPKVSQRAPQTLGVEPSIVLKPPAQDALEAQELPHEVAEAEAKSGLADVVAPVAAALATLRLTKADRTTINKLWLRMQRGGDFPAFFRNVGEVSKRADFESAYSATQLGDSILKDYALTAKLLKVVNSAYANRFGGKVYSVQHAIVILGFDRVRSLALSISLFKSRGGDERAQRVSESAINSLVSGELAQQLAGHARVYDQEQAMMCGMFRNLGRHLAIVYLPDLYEQMMDFMRTHDLSPHAAAERVFGLSLRKLGIGVAERWCLPKPIIRTMSAVPGMTGQFAREQDRLVELADFSNELCDIVVGTRDHERMQSVTNLLVRHKHLMSIDQDQLAELLSAVQQSFEQRYASLLGLDAKASRFSRNLSTLASAPEREANAQTGSRINAPQLDGLLEAEAVGAGRSPSPASVRIRPVRPKPQAQRIQLAKITLSNGTYGAAESPAVSANSNDAPDGRKAQILSLSKALDLEGRNDKLFCRILTLFAECLRISTLLVLKANASRNGLVITGGLRDDLEALTKEFRVPLLPTRASGDVFSQAYNQSRDIVVEDAFGARANAIVPLRYYETIGAPTFALYRCAAKGHAIALVLVDAESPERLPSQQDLSSVAELRPLIARSIG